jgi:hypothetical protein
MYFQEGNTVFFPPRKRAVKNSNQMTGLYAFDRSWAGKFSYTDFEIKVLSEKVMRNY